MPRRSAPTSTMPRVQTSTLGDRYFSGMDVQQEPHLLEPGKMELCYNLFPFRQGGLRRRPGVTCSSLTPLARVYAVGYLSGSFIYAASTTSSATIRLYKEDGTEILHQTLSSPSNRITLTDRAGATGAQGIQFVNFGSFLYGVDGVRKLFRVYKVSSTYYWADVESFTTPDAPVASLNVNLIGATGSWVQPTSAASSQGGNGQGLDMLAATDGTPYYDLRNYADGDFLATSATAGSAGTSTDPEPWYSTTGQVGIKEDDEGFLLIELDSDPDPNEDAKIISWQSVPQSATLHFPTGSPATAQKKFYHVVFAYSADTRGGEWKTQTIEVTLHLRSSTTSLGSVTKTFTVSDPDASAFFDEWFDLRSVTSTFDNILLTITNKTPAGGMKRAGVYLIASYQMTLEHRGYFLSPQQSGTRWAFQTGNMPSAEGNVWMAGERIQFNISTAVEDWSAHKSLFLDLQFPQGVEAAFRVYVKHGTTITYLNDPVAVNGGFTLGTSGITAANLQNISAWGIEFLSDISTFVNGQVPLSYVLFTVSGLSGGGTFPAGRTYVYRIVEADLVDEGAGKPNSSDDYVAESPGSPYSNAVTALDSTYSIGLALPASLANSTATLYKIYRNGGIYEDGYDRLVAMVFVSTGESTSKYVWNATTKVFTDLTADTDLLNADILEPGRDGPPLAPALIAVHQNRLILAQDNTVYVSWLPGSADERPYFTLITDLSDPNVEVKGVTFNLAGRAGSAYTHEGPLHAMVSYGTVLFLFRTGEIHFLAGWNPTNFTTQPFLQARGLGCSRYNAALVVEDDLWVAMPKQIYRIRGQSYEPVGLPLRGVDLSDPIIVKWNRMVFVRAGSNTIYNFFASYQPIRSPTEKFPPGNSPTNYEWFVFDYDSGAWSVMSFPFPIETGYTYQNTSYDPDLLLYPYDGTLAYKGTLSKTWWQNKGQDSLGATNHPLKWVLVTRGHGVSETNGPAYYQMNRPSQVSVGIGMENAGTTGYKAFTWRVTSPRGATQTGSVSLAEDGATVDLERWRYIHIRGLSDVRDAWHQVVLSGTADQDLAIYNVALQMSESTSRRA